jgi:hypothetical protein
MTLLLEMFEVTPVKLTDTMLPKSWMWLTVTGSEGIRFFTICPILMGIFIVGPSKRPCTSRTDKTPLSAIYAEKHGIAGVYRQLRRRAKIIRRKSVNSRNAKTNLRNAQVVRNTADCMY